MTDECRRIRDLLDSYICGELLVETNHQVLDHLSRCRVCAGELERRQSVIALLRQDASSTDAGEADLRRRIELAIDVDAQPPSPRRQRSGWWTRAIRRWPVAAALVVLVSAWLSWFVFRGQAVDAAAYRDSVANHVECALTRPAAMTFDATRVAQRLPAQFVPLAKQLHDLQGADHLIDAHACPYKNRVYAHFVFRENGRTTSLFVDEHPEGALPAPSATSGRGFRVNASATASHQMLVISDATTSSDTFVSDLLERSVVFARGLEEHDRAAR